MTAGKRWGAFGALLAVLALAVAAVGAGVGASKTNAQAPIVIGWAFDSKGNMAPFDGPALAAAKVRINQINAKGGVMGRPLRIDTCDTNNNNAAKAKSCAASLLGKGAHVIFTTCDVDLAAPVVQEAINRGVLAVAACIGTDQMGPKRFGSAGKLAFSFGNVAQDEGSAMAEYAYRRGWRTANLATNTLLVYFKNVVQAFDKRFTQLGGKIAGRGTYWVAGNPQVTDYYAVTFASAFGDDPIPAVRTLAKQLKAFTGGFVTGSAAIDGVVTAIRRSGGSTTGSTLATTMEKFKKVPTLSGLVSFSPQFHSVFGRQYRVIKIHNNKARYVGAVTAKVVPKI